MRRPIVLFSCLCLMVTWSSSEAAIVYHIDPVSLSNSYSVSGFIQTDGTLGSLSPVNITDYVVSVSGGSFPYTFTPSSPGASLSMFGTITATPTMFRAYDTPGDILSATMLFLASDSSHPQVADGTQSMAFVANASGPSTVANTRVEYSYFDSIDFDPADLVSVSFPAPPDTPVTLVIATVPEPSAFLFLALVGLAFAARKKSWKNNKN